jgi:hypothetical protein
VAGTPAEDPGEGKDSDWLKRPFRRTFDLISSEYGWTDGQILDLTLGRIREVRDLILTRRSEQFDRDVRLEEAKLRILAGAVHGAAGNKAGVSAASSIELIDRSKQPKKPSDLPSTEAVMAAVGGVDRQFGLFSDDDIAAEVARLKSEGELREEEEWEVNRG